MMYQTTKANKADLLTKTFVRARHRELTNLLLEIRRGEEFLDFNGNVLQHELRAPRRRCLYKTLPPGMKVDLLIPQPERGRDPAAALEERQRWAWCAYIRTPGCRKSHSFVPESRVSET